jgi:hypothetical protein
MKEVLDVRPNPEQRGGAPPADEASAPTWFVLSLPDEKHANKIRNALGRRPLPSLGLLHNSAAFHDEVDFLEQRDIGERVSRDGDDVGELAGVDGADLIGPS